MVQGMGTEKGEELEIVIHFIPPAIGNYYLDHLIHYELQNGDMLIYHSSFFLHLPL